MPSLITRCMAYAVPAATSGVSAWVHSDFGGWTSSPFASVILSIAMGVQATPLPAMPAKAVAIESGATSFVPSTADGNCDSGW